jgi:hypothetical protein
MDYLPIALLVYKVVGPATVFVYSLLLSLYRIDSNQIHSGNHSPIFIDLPRFSFQ